MFPFRAGVIEELLQHTGGNIFAFALELANPTQVVEAHVVQLDVRNLAAKILDGFHDHADGHVAEPYALDLAVLEHGLRDDTGRIGEVKEVAFRRELFHGVGHIKDARDGPDGAGEAADAGGFLADDVVAQAQALIFDAGLHLADADLGDDVLGAGHRFAHVGRFVDREGIAVFGGHATGEIGVDLEARGIEIHHPDFFDGDGFEA